MINFISRTTLTVKIYAELYRNYTHSSTSATFLQALLDSGDSMNSPDQNLKKLDSLCAGCGCWVHHCHLSGAAGCPSLSVPRQTHKLLLVFILGLFPPHRLPYDQAHTQFGPRSQAFYQS
ncbi:hypothetical protein AMECASPLE_018466 [Ameca splendens]|uniref:Uncharacterized protein n=1 Tax=Ameca splendens TaxID=208324 RepID=A0ABV0ZYR5_9TELE